MGLNDFYGLFADSGAVFSVPGPSLHDSDGFETNGRLGGLWVFNLTPLLFIDPLLEHDFSLDFVEFFLSLADPFFKLLLV